MYGRKRAKTHVMFELRSEEGMYKKLIVNHLREDPKKFAEFFRLSLEQFDFLGKTFDISYDGALQCIYLLSLGFFILENEITVG